MEDQTIVDFGKLEKPKSSSEELVDSDIICPPMVPIDDNRGVQVDDTSLVDENSTELSVEPRLRRSTRERQPSTRYSASEYVMLVDGGEPENYQEILSHENKGEWLSAMQNEMKSLA